MLKSITIKNFKAIGKSGLTLNNLANVNYLVGPNGCGKSSVLECIEYFVESGKLKDLPLDSRNFKIDFKLVGTFSKAELGYKPILHPLLRISESEVFLIRTIEYFNNVLSDQNFQNGLNNLLQNFDTEARHSSRIPTQLDGSFQIRLNKSCVIKTLKIKGNEIPKIDFKKNALTQLERDELLGILKDIGGFKIEADIPFIYVDSNVLILKDQENTAIPIETLSDGQKVVIKFFFLLKNDPSINIILIDEPETGLHPQVQKMLPELFAQFPNVKFIISTHSPFIISAAAKLQDSQKVYLINGGETVGLDFDPQNPENYENYSSLDSQKGYNGGECLLVTNKLLGAGINDYFPSIILFCEESLRVFIREFVRRDGIKTLVRKSPLLIPAGGDCNILNKGEIAKKIIESFIDYKKNKFDFLHSEVKAVVDINPEVYRGKNKTKMEYLEEDLIILDNTELEQIFYSILPDKCDEFFALEGKSIWNGKDIKKYLESQGIEGKSEQGIFKANFALEMSKHFTIESFKQFSLELHECIFGITE